MKLSNKTTRRLLRPIEQKQQKLFQQLQREHEKRRFQQQIEQQQRLIQKWQREQELQKLLQRQQMPKPSVKKALKKKNIGEFLICIMGRLLGWVFTNGYHCPLICKLAITTFKKAQSY